MIIILIISAIAFAPLELQKQDWSLGMGLVDHHRRVVVMLDGDVAWY